MDRIRNSGDEKLFKGALLFHAKTMGLVLGTLFGIAIFVATNWLLLKGGHTTVDGRYVVGPHLKLLNQFFIGYKVSFIGSIVGFIYGFVIGSLSGALLAWIYNKIVMLRNKE